MEYGKFNSAEELLKGYNELEKSFTQKCQQLSELKQQLEQTLTNDGTSENSPPSKGTEETKGAAAEVQAACAVPADEFKSAASDGPSPQIRPLPKVMTSGGNVSLIPPAKPKTIKEASVLARQLFNS